MNPIINGLLPRSAALLLTFSVLAASPVIQADDSRVAPSPTWLTNLSTAKELANQKSKPILLLLLSPGCGICRFMMKEVYRTPSVEQALDKWIVVYLDLDTDSGLKDLYRIQHTPASIILSSDAEEQGRLEGIHPAEVFLGFLDQNAARAARLNEIRAKLAIDPNQASLWRTLGDIQSSGLLYPGESPQITETIAAYEKASSLDPAAKSQLADRLFFCNALKVSSLNPDEFRQVGQKLLEFESQFPDSPLVPQSAFLRILLSTADEGEEKVRAKLTGKLREAPSEPMKGYYKLALGYLQTHGS